MSRSSRTYSSIFGGSLFGLCMGAGLMNGMADGLFLFLRFLSKLYS